MVMGERPVHRELMLLAGRGWSSVDIQELYRLHLKAGSGARVEVSSQGTVREGLWLVSDGEFQVSLLAEPAGNSGDIKLPDLLRADLRVYLRTGIHSFPAYLRCVKDTVWRVSIAGPVNVIQNRRVVRLPVNVEVLCRSSRGEERLMAKDVSSGGVLLHGTSEPRVGEELELEFAEEPWSELGSVKGTVRWARRALDGWDCGVALRGLSREQEQLLIHLLAQGLMSQARPGGEVC